MSKPSSRLGKGLDALIPTKIDEVAAQEVSETLELHDDAVVQIPIDQIEPNPFQPRKEFVQDDLADLAASIKEHGIVQPLVVTKTKGGYQLIAGERRLRSAQLIGLKKVPAILRSVDHQHQLEVAVVENIQRADLTVLELAVAYQKLGDQFNLTPEQISARVGKSASAVSNLLRLLKLPYDVKKALQDGSITEGHARTLLGIDDPKQQKKLLDLIINKELTVRQAEELARNYKQDKELNTDRSEKRVSAFRGVSDGLTKYLGTKVSITQNAQCGKLHIRFFSEEELGRLVEQITGEDLL